MRTKFFSVFTAALAALFVVAGCQEKPQTQTPAGDNFITVSPEEIAASWEEGIYDVTVESNCSWTVSKTDAEGNVVDWVQCDVTSGKNNTSFQILVQENPYAERTAVVTLTCGDVKAFIDIVQESNPSPIVPKPEVKLYEYYFDFTTGKLDWPTTIETSWGTLKSFDSGLALDLGTEANDETNPRRRGTVTYSLDGKDFDFVLADPNDATAHNIYLDAAKGVYMGTYRYFGLPAIEGKKLVKVEATQNASTLNNATNPRDIGITVRVYNVANTQAKKFKWVDGGEPLAQDTNMATYTYELSETAVNTVYWLVAPNRAAIIHSLRLFYADADGSEPQPEPDVEPEVEMPEPEPEPTPLPELPANAMKLTFDFTGAPLSGWPTEQVADKGEKLCIYNLDGTDYTFTLTACLGASKIACYWKAPVEGETPAPGYFNFHAEKRYLGLPAIEGYALCRVVCNNAKMSATVPEVGVTKIVAADTNHPADTDYVTGGECQTWTVNGGGTYTYALSNTTANTVYYLYAYKKGAVASLDLYYAPVTE